jgi:hypothetical protein
VITERKIIIGHVSLIVRARRIIAAGASRNISALTTVDTVIAIATSAKNKGFMSIRFEQAMVESDAVQDTHWALNRQLPPQMLSTTTRVFLAAGNC